MKNIKTLFLHTILYYSVISLIKLLLIVSIIVYDYMFDTNSLYDFDAYTWVIQGISINYLPILTCLILFFLLRKKMTFNIFALITAIIIFRFFDLKDLLWFINAGTFKIVLLITLALLIIIILTKKLLGK